MPNPIAAANAYASLARIAAGGGAPSASALTSVGSGGGSSFGSLVENALSSMVAKGREADAKTMQAAAGKADLVDVVTAVAETEVAVATLVSVRDKVISAYEEIFRMPI
jgi:flagellar hook-basal body complex protein FliE